MQLENTFTIAAPIDTAWAALNSPGTVAPCFPGATLTASEGDTFRGSVKVKLGPITLVYKGKGAYKERDEAARRVVIEASGRDSRGNGTANAILTATLTADGPDTTSVTAITDLTMTGRPAQFGSGVVTDVVDKIVERFAACIPSKLPGEGQRATDTSPDAAPVVEDSATPAETTVEPVAGSAEPTSSLAESASPPVDPVAGEDAASTVPPSVAGESAVTPTSPSPLIAGEGPIPPVSLPGPVAGEGAAAPTPIPAPATGEGAAAPTGPVTSTNGSSAPASTAPVTKPALPPVSSDVDAGDVVDQAGTPMLKRLLPAIGGVLVLLAGLVLWRRGRGSDES